ncbi:MAG: class I SAM-dependent methyltransferase [Anaerolineaceae bacterium]
MDSRKTPAEHAAMNAAAWDEIAVERRAWLDALGFDAAFFKARGSTLSHVELAALGNLSGKRVLHLQCATGEDTLSLANCGAIVTGLDVSAKEIDEARIKAFAAGVSANFEGADVQALPAHYRQAAYDVVYTGLGALIWLDDLDGWARGISEALKAGGTFVLYEQHPMEYVFEELEGRLVVVHSYFEKAPEYETGWGHFPTASAAATKVEFSWTMSEVVSSLGRYEVATVELAELPTWDASPDGTRRYSLDRFPGLVVDDVGKLPVALLIRARKL